MKLFRAGGMDIKVNPLFIIMLGVAALTGYWKEATIVISVVALHELAHAVVARALNVEVLSLELLPFGAVARLSDAPMKVGDEICSALAGPFMNILSVMLAVSLEKAFPGYFRLDPLFVRYSIVLAIFNLLPALPLDGGRVLRSLLTPGLGQTRATRISCYMGYILAALLIGLGIFLLIYDKTFNLTLFVIGLFIFLSVLKEIRTAFYRIAKDTMSKSDRLSKDGTLPVRNIAVYYNTPIKKLMQMRSPGVITIFNIVDDRLRVLGNIGEGELVNMAASDMTNAAQALKLR